MKKTNLLLFFLLLILSACSGSDSYLGKWKGTDAESKKFEITFAEKSINIQDEKGKTNTYEYTQNSVNYSNGLMTYGITLSNGIAYEIHFPKSDDESVALLKTKEGNLLYILSRKNYLSYDDVFKLE